MANVMFAMDLLPETADPEGSVRYTDVTIVYLYIPCKQEGIVTQWFKDNNTFIVYYCSPEYINNKKAYTGEYFTGTVLAEKNNKYSWWKSII